MADWNTHLYCAQKVNETLKLTGDELDLFLYGNLLPDVNAGWLINPKVKLEQPLTHFEAIGQGYFWSPLTFYDEYKEEIQKKNPLFLGYLFHIWLDVKIMTDFISRVPMSKMISDGYVVRSWKWKDMGVFIKDKKQSLTTSPQNIKRIVDEAAKISEIKICESDLLQITDFLNNSLTEENTDDYSLYSQKDFEDFYNEVCEDFVSLVK